MYWKDRKRNSKVGSHIIEKLAEAKKPSKKKDVVDEIIKEDFEEALEKKPVQKDALVLDELEDEPESEEEIGDL